jgi:cation diffusion facilitator family transporter
VVYVVVMALKLWAYSATHVLALLAEGLHTLSDIFVSGFLLVAAVWSRRRPDDVYMFGYGRAQYVGALVAATLFISFTSFELYRESVTSLLSGEHTAVHEGFGVAVGVLAFSMLIGLAPLLTLLKEGSKGAAAKAQLMELINDELGLLAALGGTVLSHYGYPLADPLAAAVVATIIAVNGVGLFKENLGALLGRSPEPALLAEIERSVLETPGVVGLHRLRGQQLGPDAVQIDLHVEVSPGLPIEQADVIAHAVEESLAKAVPGALYVSVHVDPAREPG